MFRIIEIELFYSEVKEDSSICLRTFCASLNNFKIHNTYLVFKSLFIHATKNKLCVFANKKINNKNPIVLKEWFLITQNKELVYA